MVVMETTTINKGDRVVTVDAFGATRVKVAATGEVDGSDFRVVWVCQEGEWAAAEREGRDPDAIPWPAEDVRPA